MVLGENFIIHESFCHHVTNFQHSHYFYIFCSYFTLRHRPLLALSPFIYPEHLYYEPLTMENV